MAVQVKNNFKTLFVDFKNDTGLDPNKNVSDYIAYYNARMNDMAYQTIHHATNTITTLLKQLPDIIALRIAESLPKKS